jgi:hypothetical protein
MKKLKKLTVFGLVEGVAQFTSTNVQTGDVTPIEFDEEKELAIVHFGERDKMKIDLGKAAMYRYEIEAPVIAIQ